MTIPCPTLRGRARAWAPGARRLPVPVCLLVAVALLCGCGATAPREDGAARAGRAFAAALAARDYPAACALLAPATREQLTEEMPCAPALRALELTPGGATSGVRVYGRQALLSMARDRLFLSLFDGGWLVTAAGCVRQPGDEPYRCSLKGD